MIRVLIPRRFKKAASLYRYAVRDELATPLSTTAVEELEWFFPYSTNILRAFRIEPRSGYVFTGHAQQLIVELRAEEERRFEELVEFGTNGSNVAHPLGFEK